MTNWFVALADQKGGASAEDALAYAGNRCYRPRYREKRVERGRKTWREYFLLGQYILVEFKMKISMAGQCVVDWAEQFHDVIHTSGVRGVLAADGMPLVVREYEVQRLRSHEHRGYVPAPARRGFVRGQSVFIQKGALADTQARYEFSCDKFDYVSIDSLMSARVVKIPRGALAAV